MATIFPASQGSVLTGCSIPGCAPCASSRRLVSRLAVRTLEWSCCERCRANCDIRLFGMETVLTHLSLGCPDTSQTVPFAASSTGHQQSCVMLLFDAILTVARQETPMWYVDASSAAARSANARLAEAPVAASQDAKIPEMPASALLHCQRF